MGSHRLFGIFLLAACAVLGVSGCSGGGAGTDGDPGFVDGGNGAGGGGGGTDGGANNDAPVVNSLNLLTDSPQLGSNADAATNGRQLTAIARDQNNNVVQGVVVVFSATSGSLSVQNQGMTDANGLATAILTTGGNPRNRSITVTATVTGDTASPNATDDISIDVVGTTLAIAGPDTAQINQQTEYTATLTDNAGAAISGQNVELSADGGQVASSNLITNASGAIAFTLTPSESTAVITVSALGISAVETVSVTTDLFVFSDPDPSASPQTIVPINQDRTVTLSWLQGANQTPVPDGTRVNFSTTRGQLSSSSVTTVNGQAQVDIISSQAGAAQILATSDAFASPTATVNVRFQAVQASSVEIQANPAIMGTDATSSITAVVRDPSNNLVANKDVEFNLTDTTGGSISTSLARTDDLGVARVTFSSSSSSSGEDGIQIQALVRNDDGSFVTDNVGVTVGDNALRILLGTGNELLEPDPTTYDLPFTAIVTDSAGNPVADADFQVSALPTRYFKGFYGLDEDGETVAFYTVPGGCPNEDTNLNGILDPGEDTNGDGILWPGNAVSVPRSPPLGDDGTVEFNATYTQDRALWIELLLTARAAVAGTEHEERRTLILPLLASDEINPPPGSPYGRADNCNDPN